jgi:hypothetical protein
MQVLGIYELPRVDRDVTFACGDSSCACMCESSIWPRAASFSPSFATAAIASRCAGRRSFWPRPKAARCPTSRDDSTTRPSMSAPSSKTSTPTDSKPWSPSTAAAGPRPSRTINAASSSRRRCARRICWGSPSGVGRWRSCGTSWWPRRSSSRSAWRRSGKSSKRIRSVSSGL